MFVRWITTPKFKQPYSRSALFLIVVLPGISSMSGGLFFAQASAKTGHPESGANPAGRYNIRSYETKQLNQGLGNTLDSLRHQPDTNTKVLGNDP